MLSERAGRLGAEVWFFYPLTEAAFVALEPDEADMGNCFVLTLVMKDRKTFRLFLYLPEAEALRVEASLRLYAGTPENNL